MIITIFQTMGGEGKSTLSRNIAYNKFFIKKFDSIALIELDRQGDTQEWLKTRNTKNKVEYLFLPETNPTKLKSALNDIISRNEIVILDCPGEGEVDFSSSLALNLGDLVLIPMRTSRKARSLFVSKQWNEIEKFLKDKTFVIVPSFIPPQTKPDTIIKHFKGIIPEIQCLNSMFYNRNTYENCEEGGLTLEEYARSVKNNKSMYKKALAALNDMNNITKNILELIT